MARPSRPRGAFREPMVWLVVALPASAVVAGIATLVLALRAGGSDAIPADVRRTAQIQVEDMRADRRASSLGLSGELRIDAATGAVTLALDSTAPVEALRLQLQLLHPSRAEADQQVSLVRSATGWHGRVAPTTHAWNLRLAPADASWRLRGRWTAGSARADLRPALPE